MIGSYAIMIRAIVEEKMKIYKVYIQFWIIAKSQIIAEDNHN